MISPQVSTTLTGSAAANYYVVAAIKSLFVGTEITNPIAIQIPAAAASLFSYQFSEEGLIVYGPWFMSDKIHQYKIRWGRVYLYGMCLVSLIRIIFLVKKYQNEIFFKKHKILIIEQESMGKEDSRAKKAVQFKRIYELLSKYQ